MTMVNPARSRAERLNALPADKRALLALLRAESDGAGTTTHTAPPDNIAILGDGTGSTADPILLIHPIGGGIYCYAELSRALPSDRPVWAVAADSLLGGDQPSTVERLAAHYVDQVLAAGRTPGVVVGWSFGGLIAYEMARVLAAAGRRVPPVVLLDTMSWPPEIPAWDIATTTRQFIGDLLRSAGARFDERRLDIVDWHQRLPVALAEAQAVLRDYGLELGFELSELIDRHRLYTNATTAMRRYRPQPHTGPVSLFHALDSDVRPDEWRQAVRGPVTVLTIPGDHYAVVRGAAARLVATAIAELAGRLPADETRHTIDNEGQTQP